MNRRWRAVVEGIPGNDVEVSVRDDLSGAGTVVLDNVVICFCVRDIGHAGGDYCSREEGKESADLDAETLASGSKYQAVNSKTSESALLKTLRVQLRFLDHYISQLLFLGAHIPMHPAATDIVRKFMQEHSRADHSLTSALSVLLISPTFSACRLGQTNTCPRVNGYTSKNATTCSVDNNT